MEPDRWRRIDDLLEVAIDLPTEQRHAFLEVACQGDAGLRADLERLLKAYDDAGGFLRAPAMEAAARQLAGAEAAAPIGQTLGHYEVTSRLGAGGMGVVYLARDLRLGRQVALKFLPFDPLVDSAQRRRFLREARASAALEHPNIAAVHEVADTPDGRLFIVMSYCEGLTLRQLVQRGAMPLTDVIDIASQIASGLGHAHSRGIVHRDIKPENVIVTGDGLVKIIDFGLAHLCGSSRITRRDGRMGTAAYLSPEQARGDDVDERTDVWSLGAVMYEMLTGEVPFPGPHPEAAIHRILTKEPRPLGRLRPDTPPELERIVRRALQKDLDRRYRSAAALLEDLTVCRSSGGRPGHRGTGRPAWTSDRRVTIPALLILLALGALAVWSIHQENRRRWARETLIPEIGRLVEQDSYVAAFDLARQAERYVPDDPRLQEYWPMLSRPVSVVTTPPDADVYMKEYEAVDGAWTHLGRSPLERVRIPSGLFRWKVEKPGYATAEDVASGWYRPVSFVLEPVERVPAGMVRVAGGTSPYNLIVSGFENVEAVTLPDFWMDRHEVSNGQFRQFVASGAYQARDYWKHRFVIDGREASWEDATSGFRDATGRSGPASWEAGDHPAGREDYPVGGVSWYEAAAYCESVGRRLPTVYHWNRAAIAGDAWISSYVFPFSNFRGDGAARLGSHFGMSRGGTIDMAGNVKEWTWNEAADRKRYILGGGWNEPAYMFHEADARPPMMRDATFGFRCMKEIEPPAAPQTLLDPVVASGRNYARERPVSDEVFRAFRELYAYDRTPLHPTVVSVDSSHPDWIRERISFDAAYGNERMAAVLFLPRNASAPFQTVVHFPAAESMYVRSSDRLVEMSRIDFLLKSGRAVLWPIYKGTYERPDGMLTYFPNKTVRYRDRMIQWRKDLGRSLDYLETRSEIDRDRIAFYGYSWGACLGAILPALEDRLKVSVLMGPGFHLEKTRPEVDQINFAPRVTIPTLILDGRDDFVFPRETSQQPFFRLLGTPAEHKRLAMFAGGHSVPRHHLIRESLDWLDKYLGPVHRTRR